MREVFPTKRPGDSLSAEHINKLSSVCRRLAVGSPGSYSSGTGHSVPGRAGLPPFVENTVEVVEETEDFLYLVRPRYYDHQSEEWSTDDKAGPFEMDAREFEGVYNVGAKVVAYWDQQRIAFIPTGVVSQAVHKIGKAYGSIAAGSTTGSVKIWEYDSDAGELVETDEILTEVYHDWCTNDVAINDDDEVILGWFAAEGIWRVIGAECP